MHALLEIFPLIGLVAGYFIGKSIDPDQAMYFLSYGAIIGTAIQFTIYKIRNIKMQKSTLITGLLLVSFAVMTIVFKNDLFIKLKPTVVSWGFALFFWGYVFFKKQSVLELMMGEQFSLPAQKWITLNWAWVIFNIVVGLANLIIVWNIQQGNLSDGAWLGFKAALLPISIVFVIGQSVYLFKNATEKDETQSSQEM